MLSNNKYIITDYPVSNGNTADESFNYYDKFKEFVGRVWDNEFNTSSFKLVTPHNSEKKKRYNNPDELFDDITETVRHFALELTIDNGVWHITLHNHTSNREETYELYPE